MSEYWVRKTPDVDYSKGFYFAWNHDVPKDDPKAGPFDYNYILGIRYHKHLPPEKKSEYFCPVAIPYIRSEAHTKIIDSWLEEKITETGRKIAEKMNMPAYPYSLRRNRLKSEVKEWLLKNVGEEFVAWQENMTPWPDESDELDKLVFFQKRKDVLNFYNTWLKDLECHTPS